MRQAIRPLRRALHVGGRAPPLDADRTWHGAQEARARPRKAPPCAKRSAELRMALSQSRRLSHRNVRSHALRTRLGRCRRYTVQGPHHQESKVMVLDYPATAATEGSIGSPVAPGTTEKGL